MSNITNIQFSVNLGVTYKIALPQEISLGAGFWPRTKNVIVNDEEITLKAGFRLEKEKEGIGKLADNYPNELAIAFTPYQHGDYAIFFYAHTGEVIRFGASPVEVHDHASIMTGGPAYGTYYSGPEPGAEE